MTSPIHLTDNRESAYDYNRPVSYSDSLQQTAEKLMTVPQLGGGLQPTENLADNSSQLH